MRNLFGWDYPPGVTSIPGDYDKTISFDVIFLYEGELEDDETIEDIPQIIRDWFNCDSLEILQDNFEYDEFTRQFYVFVQYSDDIEREVKSYTDIDELIIEYMSEEVGIDLDYNDNSVEINYDVHS